MDLIDRKILAALDENCRKPLSVIAKKSRSSRAVVGYRIKKLEQEGFILRYIASINLGKLGFSTYKIYFKVWNHDKNFMKNFVGYLESEPGIIHVIKTEGAFDFSIVVATRNVFELDEIVTQIKNKFHKAIRDYRLSIIVSSKVFGRKKILGLEEKNLNQEVYSGGENEKQELDDEDKKILKVLSKDASLPIVKLATETRLSVDVVKYRMKKLISTGTINAFRILFNLKQLGFYHYTFLFNFTGASKEEHLRLVAWSQVSKNVMYITKRVGFWDYEMHVAIKDLDDFEAFSSEFELAFSSSIADYETVVQREIYKLTYWPF